MDKLIASIPKKRKLNQMGIAISSKTFNIYKTICLSETYKGIWLIDVPGIQDNIMILCEVDRIKQAIKDYYSPLTRFLLGFPQLKPNI